VSDFLTHTVGLVLLGYVVYPVAVTRTESPVICYRQSGAWPRD